MNKRQIQIVGMVGAINRLLDDRAETLASVTAVGEYGRRLKEIVADIEAAHAVQTNASAGKTNAKELVKEDMLDEYEIIAHAVIVLSRKIGKVDLIATADHNRTKLDAMREDDLRTIVKSLLQAARTLLPDLGFYGVTEEDTNRLQRLIEEFEGARDNRDDGNVERMNARVIIETRVAEAEEILSEGLDRIFVRYRTRNPELYNLYTTSRRVHINGVRHNPPPDPPVTSPEPPATSAV